MFCPSCAKEIPDDAVVCVGCGRAVQPLLKSTVQTAPEQGWSDKTIYFFLFVTPFMPPIGMLAGFIGLFKKSTRAAGINALSFGFWSLVLWISLTPVFGILVSLACAFIGYFGRGRLLSKLGSQTQTAQAKSSTEVAGVKTCPKCAETILLDAQVCRFCGNQFSPEDIAAARRVAQEKATQAQLEAMERGRQNRKVLAVIAGGALTLVGGLLTITFIFYSLSSDAAQSAQTSGAITYIGPFICSLPILAVGAGLLYLGLRKKPAAPAIPVQI